MLIATWIITFVLIVGIGVYAGTKTPTPASGPATTSPWASLPWERC